jgi:hypothetical protein
MADSREGSRAVLEPAAWIVCRFIGAERRDADGMRWTLLRGAVPAPADDTLTLLIGWGGGGRYHHTEIEETDDEVGIRVLIEHHVPADSTIPIARTLELRTALVEVHLAASLGDRWLVQFPEDDLTRALREERWVPVGQAPVDVVRSGQQPRAR